MISAIRARLDRVLRADGGMLIGFLLIAGLAFAFLKLGSEMLEGETLAFDRRILRALRTGADAAVPVGPQWLNQLMLDVTALGGVTGLTLLTLATVGLLLVARKYATALFVAVAVIGATVLELALKALYARPRPDLVAHLVSVDTSSFPSGHAMNSAAVFLTLGGLLARTQSSRPVRIYLLSVAIVLTLLVGISRVYLGVHWPSDVLAGWCVGGAWAILAWIVARRLQLHHQIEPPDPAPEGESLP